MNTVLVVDDERTQVDALVELLSPRYETIGATTAHDALRAVARRAEHGGSVVDVIVLDADVGYPAFDLMAEIVHQGLLIQWIIHSGRDMIPGTATNIAGYVGYVRKGTVGAGERLIHFIDRAIHNPPDRVARAETPTPAASRFTMDGDEESIRFPPGAAERVDAIAAASENLVARWAG